MPPPPPACAFNCPLLAVKFVPAIAETKLAMVDFLLLLESLLSINPKLSAVSSNVAALRVFKSVPPVAVLINSIVSFEALVLQHSSGTKKSFIYYKLEKMYTIYHLLHFNPLQPRQYFRYC